MVVEKIQFWRDQKRRLRAETQQVELENANLAIEVARNAIHEGIVQQRLLPAATDLLAGDDLDFDVQVEEDDE